MDDNVNPFPWIKENIVSSSAGGSSLHRQGILHPNTVDGSSLRRQGICIILQKSATKICPCVGGHCSRHESFAVGRYQYFSVLLQFLHTSKWEHFFNGDFVSYPHVVPSVRLGFYILPALSPSGQLYAVARL